MADSRHHHNMVHSSNGGDNNDTMNVAASSASSSSASSSNVDGHLTVNQADSAVMIPLSAGDLDALRASGIHFNAPATISNNNNLNFNGANVIFSNAVDNGDVSGGVGHPIIMEAVSLADQQHQQQGQQQHMQRQQPHQQNIGRASSSHTNNVLDSNEITSNGIIDSQNLGNGHMGNKILNMANSSEGMNNSGANTSASSLIQALGAVSRAVASGNFSNILPSSMNLPISLNQSGIISGNDVMTFNAVPSSIMNMSGANPQMLLNQQQQLVLNQASNLVDGNSIMNTTPSVNLHHGAVSTSTNSSIGDTMRGMAGGSGVTSSAGLPHSSMVAVSLDHHQQQQQQHQQQQEQHQQQMWVQPDQSGFLPAAVSLATPGGLTLQNNQGHITIQQGPSSSQERSSLQELQQVQLDGNQFQDVRSHFSGVFQAQQQGNRASETYQAAAHSTYDRSSPAQDYREISTENEATPNYPNPQQLAAENQAAVNAAAQLIAAPTVDSSTLQQGYQLLYDADNRVITVQRVMSPSDCTVSQSTLSLEGSEAQPNPALLPMSSQAGQSFTMVQVSSMPGTYVTGNTNGEVSTSSMAAILGVRNGAGPSGVSSLNGRLSSTSSSHTGMGIPKAEKSELEESTECDTTQGDIEFTHNRTPTYMDNSGNIDDDPSLDSTTLHSTMQGSQVANSTDVIMDSTLDSSDLTPLRAVAVDSSEEVLPSQQPSGSGLQSSQSGGHNSMEVNEAVPGPSGLQYSRKIMKTEPVAQPIQARGSVRKSRRLELVGQEPKASQRKRDYKSQQYNPDMLWCEDCMQAYENQCPTHRLSAVPDKVVMSRAWASCPNQVQIFRVPEAQLGEGDPALGVQAKRQIPKFSQFGPFTGELVDSLDKVNRKVFPLLLEYPEGSKKYFETEDENKCNWMMFVRPAKTFAEQNVVAYQFKQDIYFSATKLIESKQELKVWYAAHYAERLGIKTLEMTEEDMQALDEEDAKFACFECSRKFKSSAALQQHLSTHEMEDMRDFDEDMGEDEDFISNAEEAGSRNKQKGTFVRGKLLKGKNRNHNTEAGNYQWKKKSTSIYLNKSLKKYKKRQCSDKLLQNMKGMYKKQGKVSGGNEWMCTHCGLTFDNSSLLNLHTLTHAAEDLGMDEIKKIAEERNPELTQSGASLADGSNGEDHTAALASIINLEGPMVACPKCNIVFNDHKSLMEHVSTHAQKVIKSERPFDCNHRNKSFGTEEKLLRHQMVHGDEASKPLECPVCHKRVMNNSAMACHMKTHSERKYYDCPVCGKDFDIVANLKEHAGEHMAPDGQFPCPSCQKSFEDFASLKKHMKSFHSDRVFECPECSKPFPRVDKLRLHMLRHTSHREFMCETCGRQFKRKDKLKEHMKRMHSKERMEQQLLAKQQQSQVKQINRFTPKVMPSEYHRFIYKCHTCLLGFKRRGMLVNHLAKRHPEIKPEQVPELNLPILKTQKDFYCQYCDKIYKSSSKRKAHIQKNHPGCQVPPSSRKKLLVVDGASTSFNNSSFSHTVSSITTMPHGCKFCHKQYASKAKLLQHQRKEHSDLVEPANDRRKPKKPPQDFLHITVGDPAHGLTDRYDAVPIAVVSQTDTLPSADLLTQAMSELQNYTSEFTINPRLTQGGPPTMVHIQSNGQLQPATIDISQLNQALHSFSSQSGGVATVLAPPPQPTSPTQSVTVVAPNGTQTFNLSNAQFITRTWTGSFPPPFR